MFVLKNCTEEDFYQFTYSDGKYHPEDFDGYLLGLLIGIFAFGGIEYWYLSAVEIQNKKIINIICMAFIFVSVLILIMTRINNKKYSYKFQKVMVLVLALYWFIFSICIYPAPLILGIAEHHTALVQAVICAAIIGLIYFVYIFIRLIYLIRKGEMGEQCEGLYERLISSKIAVGAGVSVPFVVISGKLARNLTNVMDSAGNKVGPLVMMLIFGFVINIIMVTFLPEFIILAYCKFRFESFNIPGEASERERMYKRERKSERLEQRKKQINMNGEKKNSRKKRKRRNK